MYLTVFDEHILILFYQFHPGNRGLMNKTVIKLARGWNMYF